MSEKEINGISKLALHQYANHINLSRFGATDEIKQRNAKLAKQLELDNPGIADVYAKQTKSVMSHVSEDGTKLIK